MTEIIDFFKARDSLQKETKPKPKAKKSSKKCPDWIHQMVMQDLAATEDMNPEDYYDLMPCNPKKLLEDMQKCFQITT